MEGLRLAQAPDLDGTSYGYYGDYGDEEAGEGEGESEGAGEAAEVAADNE